MADGEPNGPRASVFARRHEPAVPDERASGLRGPSRQESRWRLRSRTISVHGGTSGRSRKIVDIPNLIEIQKRSYEEFLQRDGDARRSETSRPPGRLQVRLPDQGLQRDRRRSSSSSYALGEPKYDVEECHQRGMTFAAPLKVTVQLRHLGRRPRERGALDQERQGAGGLLRRDPADDAATAPS